MVQDVMAVEDDEDTFIPLADATLLVLDRAAAIWQGSGPRWRAWHPENSDLFDHAFWDRLYGPSGDGPEDHGMLDWFEIGGYDDC